MLSIFAIPQQNPMKAAIPPLTSRKSMRWFVRTEIIPTRTPTMIVNQNMLKCRQWRTARPAHV